MVARAREGYRMLIIYRLEHYLAKVVGIVVGHLVLNLAMTTHGKSPLTPLYFQGYKFLNLF